MTDLKNLKIKIFADGADLVGIKEMAAKPLISGFTTNPTLMRKAGVEDYRAFALEAMKIIGGKPISFEVFADDFENMERQARKIASWGENIYVKIPVTNTKGEFSGPLIAKLSAAGVKLNITAMLTAEQAKAVTECLHLDTPAIESIFTGRIADTGCDPMPIMIEALKTIRTKPRAELLWASPREVLNIFQADSIGCHIITATNDILKKLSLVSKDLVEYSRETVKMFYEDAKQAGYKIDVSDKN